MTDSDANKSLEFDDLEPLPEDAELTELPELPDEAEPQLAELPDEAEVVELEPLPSEAESVEPAPAPAPAPSEAESGKPAPAFAAGIEPGAEPESSTKSATPRKPKPELKLAIPEPPPEPEPEPELAALQESKIKATPKGVTPIQVASKSVAPGGTAPKDAAPKDAAPKSSAPAAAAKDSSTPTGTSSSDVASAPKPAPAPRASAVAQASAPLKAGAVSASSGSRRERMEQDREARKTQKKKHTWVRFEGPGEKPKREMEKAPLILRKAALWLLIGCLLPWGGYTSDWAGNLVEKLLVLAGLYVWHQAHLLRDGAKVAGFIASLGKQKFTPLFVLAGLLVVVGFAPILSMASLSADVMTNAGPIAEKGFMILAGMTLTHIYDYEHGGRFNPMYPIMFLAPAIAGIMALLKVFGAESINVGVLLGGAGAILVAVAGSMAAYTMYVALKEAKVHGEAKKAAQAEARKAARASRRKV